VAADPNSLVTPAIPPIELDPARMTSPAEADDLEAGENNPPKTTSLKPLKARPASSVLAARAAKPRCRLPTTFAVWALAPFWWQLVIHGRFFHFAPNGPI
jgi:hypothetical protein